MTAHSPTVPLNRRFLGLAWLSQITARERRTLLAGGLGWTLDAFDVMLYSMVLAFLMRDLGMNSQTAGLLGALTLVASALGGMLFGLLADRVGRIRSLTASFINL